MEKTKKINLNAFFNKFKEKSKLNTKKKTTLIFDISSVFKSHLCAHKGMTDNGIPLGGVIGTINSIIYMSKDYRSKDIICVFDGKYNAKKRQQIYDQYKIDRGKKNDNVRSPLIQDAYKAKKNKEFQEKILVSFLKKMPVKIINIRELEADDIIAYLTKDYYKDDKDGQRIIVTEDKDMLQLLDNNTHMYKHRKRELVKYQDLTEYDFGKIPENIIYYRIVEGDKSDNVDGVYGIGSKSLVKLLPEIEKQKINSLEGFFELLDQYEERLLSSKKGKSLVESKTLLERNYRLMNLSLSNEMITHTEESAILELMKVNQFKEANIMGIRQLISNFRLFDTLSEGKFKNFINKMRRM